MDTLVSEKERGALTTYGRTILILLNSDLDKKGRCSNRREDPFLCAWEIHSKHTPVAIRHDRIALELFAAGNRPITIPYIRLVSNSYSQVQAKDLRGY